MYGYHYGYYGHIAAYASGSSNHSIDGGNKYQPGGPSYTFTSLTRQITVKTQHLTAGASPTRAWRYSRGDPSFYTNPTSVIVTDPFLNDTVYLYNASHPSPDPLRRTNAPDVTTTKSEKQEVAARRRKPAGDNVRTRTATASTIRSVGTSRRGQEDLAIRALRRRTSAHLGMRPFHQPPTGG